jgi:hypothetical protein
MAKNQFHLISGRDLLFIRRQNEKSRINTIAIVEKFLGNGRLKKNKNTN